MQVRKLSQATRTPGFLIYIGGYAALLAWFKLADVYHTQFATRGPLVDVGRIHPMCERSLRALHRTVPENVRLYPGLSKTSLPAWLKDNTGPAAAFIHIDCDLYSSTKTIFALLADRLIPGTIILLDEYFNFPNWEQHEYKTFQEFVAKQGITYTYLGFARQQVAVRIESKCSTNT